jgi:hypothetical protein
MMKGKTVVVTIGRNVGTKPMDTKAWQAFKRCVLWHLNDHGGNVIQRPNLQTAHDQMGTWEGKVSEDAATFVALFRWGSDLSGLGRDMAFIAKRFDQEAIGLIIAEGTDHLVYPARYAV